MGKRKIQEEFEEFDAKHPEVYEKFRAYSEGFAKKEKQRYEAKGIVERIRWGFSIAKGEETFKIDNRFTSRLARKLIAERPEFAGFFETRVLKTE